MIQFTPVQAQAVYHANQEYPFSYTTVANIDKKYIHLENGIRIERDEKEFGPYKWEFQSGMRLGYNITENQGFCEGLWLWELENDGSPKAVSLFFGHGQNNRFNRNPIQ